MTTETDDDERSPTEKAIDMAYESGVQAGMRKVADTIEDSFHATAAASARNVGACTGADYVTKRDALLAAIDVEYAELPHVARALHLFRAAIHIVMSRDDLCETYFAFAEGAIDVLNLEGCKDFEADIKNARACSHARREFQLETSIRQARVKKN